MIRRLCVRYADLLVALVATCTTVVAIIRLLGADGSPLTIGLIAVAPALMLGGWFVAAFGLAKPSRPLAVLGVVLVVLQLVWALADIPFVGSGGAPMGERGGVVIASANVDAHNESVGVLFETLAAQAADVVLLQEMTDEQVKRVAATSSYADYPHRVLDPLPGVHGSVILSRLPLRDGGVIWLAGWPMTEAVVEAPDGPLRIVNVHAVAPLTIDNVELWHQQFVDLATLVESSAEPVALVGDFNATGQHRGPRDLRGMGMTDAHLTVGSGLGATFPANIVVPPLLRLDRALSSDGLEPVSFETLPSPGSDHKAIVVELLQLD